MDYSVVLGRNVRKIRKSQNLSQEELGFRADMKRSYVSDLERGRRNPSLKAIGRLAEALSVDPCALVKIPDHTDDTAGGQQT